MKVKCSKCGYEWNTKSKAMFVCCPSCINKTRIREKRTALSFLRGDGK